MSDSADHLAGVTGVGGVAVGGCGVSGADVGSGVAETGAEIAVDGSGGPDVPGTGCAARGDALTVTRGAVEREGGTADRRGAVATVSVGCAAALGTAGAVTTSGAKGVPGLVGWGEAINRIVITTGIEPMATRADASRRSRRTAPGG